MSIEIAQKLKKTLERTPPYTISSKLWGPAGGRKRMFYMSAGRNKTRETKHDPEADKIMGTGVNAFHERWAE